MILEILVIQLNREIIAEALHYYSTHTQYNFMGKRNKGTGHINLLQISFMIIIYNLKISQHIIVTTKCTLSSLDFNYTWYNISKVLHNHSPFSWYKKIAWSGSHLPNSSQFPVTAIFSFALNWNWHMTWNLHLRSPSSRFEGDFLHFGILSFPFWTSSEYHQRCIFSYVARFNSCRNRKSIDWPSERRF